MRPLTRHDFSLCWYDYCLMAILLSVSVFLQQNQFFNWDGCWHIEAAERMMQGATYTKGLFDDNLPMTFWFFMPAVFLHHMFGINKILLANSTVEVALWASFFLARPFLKKIYVYAKKWEFAVFQYSILFFLLIYASSIFGQRDFIASFLFLPYITLLGARAEGRIFARQESSIRLLAGIFAAIAVAMNPFFLCIVFIIEALVFLRHRKRSLSPELLSCGLFCVGYFLSIAIFYRDYYTEVIPSFYVFSPAYNEGYFVLFFGYCSQVIFFGIVLSFLWRKHSQYRAWLQILLSVSIVTYLLFFLHKKSWASHEIFSLFAVFLMAIIVFCEAIRFKKTTLVGLFFSLTALTYLMISVSIMLFVDASYYYYFHNKQSSMRQLISYFNAVPAGATLYSFSSEIYVTGVLMAYAKVNNITPWPNDWMLPVTKQMALSGWKLTFAKHYRTAFINQSLSDLKNKKPDYVFIEQLKKDNVLYVNFLKLLSQSPGFGGLWKNYHLAKIIYAADNGRAPTTCFIYKRVL